MQMHQLTIEETRILLENSPLGIVLTDKDLNFLYVSPSFQRMMRYSSEELLSMNVLDITAPDSINISKTSIQTSFTEGKPTTIEKRYIRKDGHIIDAITRISTVFDDAGNPLYQCTNIEDVSQQVQTKNQLEESNQDIQQLIETAHDGIIRYDKNGKILLCNVAALRIFGWTKLNVSNLSITDIVAIFNGSNSTEDNLFFNVNNDKKRQTEIRCKNTQGKTIWLEIIIVSSKYIESTRYTLFLRDISEKKIAEEQLRYLATHDVLTELPNRTLFVELLNSAITSSTRNHHKHAVLFIDLDRFKDINDSLGHNVGDNLLKQVATRFKSRIRQEDIVARLGGDEFVILVQNIKDIYTTISVADSIINEMNKPFQLDDVEEIFITVSIGLAIYPDHGNSSEALLKNVDAAMYMAKKEVNSNFQIFDNKIRNQILTRINIIDGLRKAIQNNEIIIHYQSKINLSDLSYAGCEALVRWQHPIKGIIPPNEFISIAESSGLIYSLGDHIMQIICQQTLPLTVQQHNGRVAINISSVQFRQKDICKKIELILKKYSFNPEKIELEITEGAIMEDVDNAILLMKRLRDKGIHLSIDDFGTGYSSLSYLKKLPVNSLKIDKSFIDDIIVSKADKSMVDSIINLSHNLNLAVVAEGVETKEQSDLLLEMGCDIVQGYYFSRPVDINQLKTKYFS